jgi:hypothetical protein
MHIDTGISLVVPISRRLIPSGGVRRDFGIGGGHRVGLHRWT